MSQTMHIVRKDARSLRWVLALGGAVLAARVVLVVNGATAADGSAATGLLLQQVWNTLGIVELLVMAMIAARLVLEEPLAGYRAFWLTRPYDIGSLLGAKLLFAAVALIALPLIADLVTMSLFNANPRALPAGAATTAVGYASWMLSLMVLAVLTPSLGVFVLATLGIATAASILPATLAGFARLWTSELPGYSPPGAPDSTPGVVMMAVYLCAALAVVVFQYRQRRWRLAAGLAVAGLAAAVVVPMFWPWSFARGELIRPGAWASDVAVGHDPSWGTKASDVVNVSRPMRETWRQLNARVTWSGLPPQIAVRWLGIRSTWQFPDGTAVESSQSALVGSSFETGAAEVALGARILTTRDFEQRERWTPLVTVREQEFVRRRGQPGRLTANIDLITTEMHVLGTLPLTPGASLDQGLSRLEIVAVQRGTDSRNVIIRRWRAQSALSTEPAREQFFALRRRSSAEALMAGVENTWRVGSRPNAATVLVRLPFALIGGPLPLAAMRTEGFSVGTTYLRFPGRGFGEPAQRLDPAWFDEAELVVLEATQAGVVTRPLVIEDFVIPAN